MTKELITGAELIVRSLEHLNVSTVFGVPGGAILPAYDPLYDSPIRHILARHEQGAGHMAEGYAQATGELGVVIATSGPGATNLITPLANALMDSTPLLAITGQVASTAIGNDAFQEAYTVGLSMAATKHNYLITDASEIPQVLKEAKYIATSGRPGPVLVDVPKDILNQKTSWVEPKSLDLPGYKPTLEPNPKMIQQAATLIKSSKKPILYVGGGIIHSKSHKELYDLATTYNIPVVTTLMGRGAFPDGHELCLEMPGMHGNYTATTSIQNSDLLIAIGVRFDDRVTANPDFFAQNAKVIHADIDPAEIGKVREAQVPIVGDAKSVLIGLIEALKGSDLDTASWINDLKDMKQNFQSGILNKSPATFSMDKLLWFNKYYLDQMSIDQLIEVVALKDFDGSEYSKTVMETIRDRCSTLNEFSTNADYFFKDLLLGMEFSLLFVYFSFFDYSVTIVAAS